MHGLMRSHFVIAFLVRRVGEIPNRLVSIHKHYDDTPKRSLIRNQKVISR